MAADTTNIKLSDAGFMNRLGAKLKEEGGQAALRVGARQFLRTAKAPILGMLKRKGVHVEHIQDLEDLLNTPIGEGLFGLGLGAIVPYVPGLGSKEVARVLGSELRVAGISLIGGELGDALLDPLREAIQAAFAGELGGDASEPQA